MMRNKRLARRAKLATLVLGLGTLMQLIPFGCGQSILRLVTPLLLDDTANILDFIVTAVAPLVLP